MPFYVDWYEAELEAALQEVAQLRQIVESEGSKAYKAAQRAINAEHELQCTQVRATQLGTHSPHVVISAQPVDNITLCHDSPRHIAVCPHQSLLGCPTSLTPWLWPDTALA